MACRLDCGRISHAIDFDFLTFCAFSSLYLIRVGKQRIRGRMMIGIGTVKFFDSEKGYGFIKPDQGGNDVFVHITAVVASGFETLTPGQKIRFDVEPDKKGKGPKAVNLALAA